MDLGNHPEDEQRIFLDALVTYADACTMPRLTPSCPYYREDDDGPTCREECRGISERYGVDTRPVRTARLGGLALTGRALPLAAAAGSNVFDAQQRYISERQLPLPEQSTTSLLLGMAASVRPSLLDDPHRDYARAQQIWRELVRRQVPVDRIVRGALVREMSLGIAVRAAAPHLLRLKALPPYISVDLAKDLAERTPGEWGRLLDHLVQSFDSRDAALAAAATASPAAPVQPDPRSPSYTGVPWMRPGDLDPDMLARVTADPHVALAFSRHFQGRVEEWIARLMEEDLMAALRVDPAPPSVFLALSPSRTTLDEVGLWLWERLTVTQLERWSTSTLLLEWRMQRGELVGGCSPRLLAERVAPAETVADLALERVSRTTGRHRAPRDLDPVYFTRKAAEELRAGRWENAASIFRGLVDILPANGDAWNNLGFCQLAGDPVVALVSLERASFYERHQPIVNVANRCLAFHLMGRNAEAMALAESSMHLADQAAIPAFLWIHETCDAPLRLGEDELPGPYLVRLYEHIKSGI